MKKLLKIFTVMLSFLLAGQSGASADFYGPFAPSNWTFTGDATSNSLTSTQMQIVSWNQGGGGTRTASYTVNVPGNMLNISFDFHYITNDRDGSLYDMARYSIDGVAVDLVANNIPNGGSQSGTITLNNFSGSTFAIIQEALDSILGSATITITNFNYTQQVGDYLIASQSPKLTIANGEATCSAGSYKFASGSTAEITSLVYTLIVDGQPVSRIASDPSNSIAPHMFSSIQHTVLGLANNEKVVWDVSELSNYAAHCEVTVAKNGAMNNASSNTFEDAVKIAKDKAVAQAWEDQRAAANAANFTKEARELRKRIAARNP